MTAIHTNLKHNFASPAMALAIERTFVKKPGIINCKACGSLLDTPDQEQSCQLCCANWQGEHPADDPTCPAREQADSGASKAAYLKKVQARKKLREKARNVPTSRY
ncbi:hypothetical protein HPB48_013062 [Haemaphysalis longicornis]|uniref:Uncharacterized protein n=1 Tax=Haemaphysalis longicornis TaxID=44386 RepID=A0A9J6G111_HAELO|nr:hypothetical protein HPB48_013062 [Haemaphysalis longicornis]